MPSSGMLRSVALVSSSDTSVLRLLVMGNVPSLQIIVTLMMEAQSPSETSVITGATRRNIPEDTIRYLVSCPSLLGLTVILQLTAELNSSLSTRNLD
jgi:hypothetical protein